MTSHSFDLRELRSLDTPASKNGKPICQIFGDHCQFLMRGTLIDLHGLHGARGPHILALEIERA